MVKWLVDKRWYHNLVVKLEKENKWRTSRWLMMLNIVRDELANSSIVRRINWFWWRHTHFCLLLDQTKKRVQHIVQKFSISLSLSPSISLSLFLSLSLSLSFFCSPVCLLLPNVLISLRTLQEITMTCVFKPGKVAAAGRKLFALRFLFLSSPYVLLKLSDFFCLFR